MKIWKLERTSSKKGSHNASYFQLLFADYFNLEFIFALSAFWFKIRDIGKQINPKNDFKKTKQTSSTEVLENVIFMKFKKTEVGDIGKRKKYSFYLFKKIKEWGISTVWH